MESNITKILIKKILEKMCDPPLKSSHDWGMALPLWCSLLLMTLPSEAPALPPKKNRTFPKQRKLTCIAFHSDFTSSLENRFTMVMN